MISKSMFLDRSLSIALLISVLFHALIFLPLPYFRALAIQKERVALEITYLTSQQTSLPKAPVKDRLAEEIMQEAKKKAQASLELEKDSGVKEYPKEKLDTAITKEQKAEIEIPPELPKEKEHLYIDYYQSIRERIRRFVLKNYPHFIACGEICIYFVLFSDGRLKEITILEERSDSNQLLREIAKKSVLQAAPFKAFPKELDQERLSFNVIISFELEE